MEIDRWDTLERKFDKLESNMSKVESKIKSFQKNKSENNLFEVRSINCKKNYPLHFLVEKDLTEKLKSEAKEKNISMGELCRRKLRKNSQLDRIERKIDELRKI